MIGWENNPAGICEDAPCCGCCGPQGDGRYDADEPEYDPCDDYQDPYLDDEDNDGGDYWEPSPDPCWYMD